MQVRRDAYFKHAAEWRVSTAYCIVDRGDSTDRHLEEIGSGCERTKIVACSMGGLSQRHGRARSAPIAAIQKADTWGILLQLYRHNTRTTADRSYEPFISGQSGTKTPFITQRRVRAALERGCTRATFAAGSKNRLPIHRARARMLEETIAAIQKRKNRKKCTWQRAMQKRARSYRYLSFGDRPEQSEGGLATKDRMPSEFLRAQIRQRGVDKIASTALLPARIRTEATEEAVQLTKLIGDGRQI